MSKIKFAGLLGVLLIFVSQVFASGQTPENINYNGKRYKLYSFPMEKYFEKFQDKRPAGGLSSSGLARGYVATFEVAENTLFLKDIAVQVANKNAENSYRIRFKSVFQEIFSDRRGQKVDWFSGILVMPHGERISYGSLDFIPKYENYILLEIDKGDFTKSKEFTLEQYEKFKDRQFEAFKLTDEYKKEFEDLKKRVRKRKWDDSNQFIDSVLKEGVTKFSSKFLVD